MMPCADTAYVRMQRTYLIFLWVGVVSAEQGRLPSALGNRGHAMPSSHQDAVLLELTIAQPDSERNLRNREGRVAA
jgi:hypothetical protein